MTIYGCVERRVGLAELLGRQMNEVESRHSSNRLFVKEPMELLLRRPRVSVIGTRDPPGRGSRTSGKSRRSWSEGTF